MLLRLKAFFLHLGLSAIIALLVLCLVFRLWYPAPLAAAVGVIHVFLMLLLVDVILGPMLTLLVYKAGKKTLVFDLAMIAALQLAALSYGLWAVSQGRPAWLVFNVDRFDVVQVLDIDTRRVDQAPSEYRAPGWSGPKWVAAIGPDNIERRNEILFEAVQGGSDIAQRPELYHSLAASSEQMKARALSLSSLSQFNESEAVINTLAAWPQATGWLPLMARAQPMVVLLTSSNTRVLAIVPLRPWLQ